MGPSPQANNLINGAPNRVNLNRVNADGEEEKVGRGPNNESRDMSSDNFKLMRQASLEDF